jgi:hypothetical protein
VLIFVERGAPIPLTNPNVTIADFALDPSTRGRSVCGGLADVATRLHTFVQYANDLDQAGRIARV